MTMRGVIRSILAAALMLPALQLTSVLSAPDSRACETSMYGGRASTCPRGLEWEYDKKANVLRHHGRPAGHNADGVRFRYTYLTRCENGVNCQAARNCSPGGTRFNVLAFMIYPDGTESPTWDHQDTVCVYPDRTVPVSHVTAAAHEELRKRIAAPTITSAPRGEKTLINIITIYCTQPQPEPRLDITLPAPGTITATPDYRWDFGDGQGGTGIGLAYNPPDDPAKLPGKYLGPTWTTPGLKHVTLTVTWQVTFQLDGETSIPLDPIVFTATEDKQAVTARAVLVTR